MELRSTLQRHVVAVCPSDLRATFAEPSAAVAAARAEDTARAVEQRAMTPTTAASTPRGAAAVLRELYEEEVREDVRSF